MNLTLKFGEISLIFALSVGNNSYIVFGSSVRAATGSYIFIN